MRSGFSAFAQAEERKISSHRAMGRPGNRKLRGPFSFGGGGAMEHSNYFGRSVNSADAGSTAARSNKFARK